MKKVFLLLITLSLLTPGRGNVDAQALQPTLNVAQITGTPTLGGVIQYQAEATGFPYQTEVTLLTSEYVGSQITAPTNSYSEGLNTAGTGTFTGQLRIINPAPTNDVTIVEAKAFLGEEATPLATAQVTIQPPTLIADIPVTPDTTDVTVTPGNGNCVNGVSTNPNVYCLLEPIGTGGNIWNYVNTGGTGGSNQVGEYLNGLFQIGVALAGILGVFLIVMGGFQYMTTDAISKTTEGKKMIRNAITGILLALLSWLLLNTISNNLVNFTIGTYDQPDTNYQGSNTAPGTLICGNQTVNNTPVTQGMPWPSDTTQRNTLSAAGITVAASTGQVCTTAGQEGCTSVYFEGAAQDVPSKIIQFKNLCDASLSGGQSCPVVVTGGSECWEHSTHGASRRVFDLRKNDTTPLTNAFVQSFGGNGEYQIPGIGTFVYEGAGSNPNTTAGHWHVILD